MESTRDISFIPRVYEKDKASIVLDRTFQEFGQPAEEVQERTVDQFFADYEDLYFQIPIEGATGSHQYLVEKSSELYKAGESLVDIQPLLDEINLLRSQSINDQTTIVELRTKLAGLGTA